MTKAKVRHVHCTGMLSCYGLCGLRPQLRTPCLSREKKATGQGIFASICSLVVLIVPLTVKSNLLHTRRPPLGHAWFFISIFPGGSFEVLMLGGLWILQFVFVLVISATPTCRTASELLTFGTVKVDVENMNTNKKKARRGR